MSDEASTSVLEAAGLFFKILFYFHGKNNKKECQ